MIWNPGLAIAVDRCKYIMEKLFYTDKLPVLLTLLLGLLGYQINTLTKTVLDSPAIEYSMIKKETTKNNILRYEFTIHNISSIKSFKELTINFMFAETSKIKIFNPDIIVVNPSKEYVNPMDSLDYS